MDKSENMWRGWFMWIGVPVILVASFILLGVMQGRLTPHRELLSVDTRHFSLYYESIRVERPVVARLGEEFDRLYRFGCRTLGSDPDQLARGGLRVRVYLGTTGRDMEYRDWFSSFGPMYFLDPRDPHFDHDRMFNMVTTARWGKAIPFLTQGVNIVLTSAFQKTNPHARVSALLSLNPSLAISDLFDPERFDADPAVNRQIAASFLAFLVDRYGWPALGRWYGQVTTFAQNAPSEFERDYGLPLFEAEGQWREFLRTQDDGFRDSAVWVAVARRFEKLKQTIETGDKWYNYDAILRTVGVAREQLRTGRLNDCSRSLDRIENLIGHSRQVRFWVKIGPILLILLAGAVLVWWKFLGILRRQKRTCRRRAAAQSE